MVVGQTPAREVDATPPLGMIFVGKCIPCKTNGMSEIPLFLGELNECCQIAGPVRTHIVNPPTQRPEADFEFLVVFVCEFRHVG